MAMVAELLARRVAARGSPATSSAAPLVPGRRMLVLLVQAPGPLDELERRSEEAGRGHLRRG
jgi:hypothetical protein